MMKDNVAVFTKENFEYEVLKSDKPVLVDFWAQWCGPCRAVAPIISELAREYDGRIKIGKVNVDEENELAAQFRIMSIPTVLLLKYGQTVERIVGTRSKREFMEILDRNI